MKTTGNFWSMLLFVSVGWVTMGCASGQVYNQPGYGQPYPGTNQPGYNQPDYNNNQYGYDQPGYNNQPGYGQQYGPARLLYRTKPVWAVGADAPVRSGLDSKCRTGVFSPTPPMAIGL